MEAVQHINSACVILNIFSYKNKAIFTSIKVSHKAYVCVLGRADSRNKIPLAGWFINNRIFLLQVLEAESLKSRCQDDWVLWLQTYCILTWQRRLEVCEVFLYESTNPNHEGPIPEVI